MHIERSDVKKHFCKTVEIYDLSDLSVLSRQIKGDHSIPERLNNSKTMHRRRRGVREIRSILPPPSPPPSFGA